MNASPASLGIITRENIAMPMRDGVALRANLFLPDAPGPFPALLHRTPYGKAAAGYERYVRAGYAVLSQDARGRYASDGEFVPFTEPETPDGEDGYDSVEWLADQAFCNGRVGTIGASYDAWMQWQLARLKPQHLRAMCAYTIPLELTQVDWPGAFKPGRRIKWWRTTMAPDMRRRAGLGPPHTPAEARRQWDEDEQGSWLGFMPWRQMPDFLPPPLDCYAAAWLADPARCPWKLDEIHAQVEVPNLDFSGWYDHCNGTLGHLGLMQRQGGSPVARQHSKLVVGPWNHPGLGKREIYGVDFGPQAQVDLPDIIIRWFDHWLKGIDNGVEGEPALRYFVMGSGQWKGAATWPPPEIGRVTYYLGAGSLDRAAGADGAADYTYDPRDPVPTLWTADLFSGPADRRRLEYRDDILYFRSPPLAEAVEVVGGAQVELWISSSAPDTDFFARLVDEEPEGPALEVCYGMVRARHRNSLKCEEFLVPDQPTLLTVELGPTAIRFAPGHRIRLEITSSDFPNHDRNHNTGGDDLAEVELRAARQRVYYGSQRSSRLLLPLV
ncbi:MAG: CocE/NonD family hydrolase [Candidatus Latescibacteria bacterium]|nr:CocE/NonD family hydrolase [Candidatus Latescibacterota bacterium]